MQHDLQAVADMYNGEQVPGNVTGEHHIRHITEHFLHTSRVGFNLYVSKPLHLSLDDNTIFH